MRILYHHRTQAEDAQGIHIREMVKAFEALGHSVDIIALVKRSYASPDAKSKRAWRLSFQSIPPWVYELLVLGYNLYGYVRLRREIKKGRPDLIYERYALNTCCGILAAKRSGIPLVLEVNAPLWYEQNKLGRLRFRRLARFCERWICSNATWTLVVSNVMKNMLIREGVPEEKLLVMPNGVDPARFRPEVCGRAIRQRYGLENKLVIGFVGWFRQWHGLEMLLQLMCESNLAERNIRLMLVGEGPVEPELRSYATKRGLLTEIIFTGPINATEVPAHIAAMDIVVQPRATEYACPMKLIEYMAMGKCIVAPDQSNIREILMDKVNSFLFRPDDIDSLKTVLMKLIDDPASRKIVALHAVKTVYQKELLWKSNAKRTLNLVVDHVLRNDSQFSR